MDKTPHKRSGFDTAIFERLMPYIYFMSEDKTQHEIKELQKRVKQLEEQLEIIKKNIEVIEQLSHI